MGYFADYFAGFFAGYFGGDTTTPAAPAQPGKIPAFAAPAAIKPADLADIIDIDDFHPAGIAATVSAPAEIHLARAHAATMAAAPRHSDTHKPHRTEMPHKSPKTNIFKP